MERPSSRRGRYCGRGSRHSSHVPLHDAAIRTHTLGSHRSQARADSRDRHGPAADQRSRASQENHRSYRAQREGGDFSPPPRASTRGSSDSTVEEDWLSRSHDAEEDLDRALERSRGSRRSDAGTDRRGLRRGQSDGEPLLAQSSSPRHEPAKPGDRGLLRHIFKCGRLALQARHPEFAKGTPQTVRVLKEAVDMSRPLLEEVRVMVEGDEKVKGGGGLRGKVKRVGLKWVEQQVEEAERDVRRLERRERRKERGRREEKEREGEGVGEEEEEERGAEGVENDNIAVEDPFGDGRGSSEGGREESESRSQRHSHRAHDSDAGSRRARPGHIGDSHHEGPGNGDRASTQQQASAAPVAEEPVESRSRYSRDEHAPQSHAGSHRSSDGDSRRQGRTGPAHAEQGESTLHPRKMGKTRGRHNQERDSHGSARGGSRRCGEQRPSKHQVEQQHPTTPRSAGGEGLAAEYYNSFDQSSARGERSEQRASRSRSTLRPEDSPSVRSPGSEGGSSSWSDTASRLNERDADADDRGNRRTHAEARRFRQWARRNAAHHRTDDGGQGISTGDVNIPPPPIGTQRRPSRNPHGGPDA